MPEPVMDRARRETRSRIMSAVRGSNTKPKVTLRRALHARGLRFRVSDGRFAGRPDIVFPRYGAVLFVHGCFWHRHEGCKRTTFPKTNVPFWEAKFAANVLRARRALAALRDSGWRVGVVWECAIGRERELDAALADDIADFVRDCMRVRVEWPEPHCTT